jgi:hypothetical protein
MFSNRRRKSNIALNLISALSLHSSKQETIQNHNGSQKDLQVPQEEATRQKSENQNNTDETKDTDKHNSYTGRKTDRSRLPFTF